VDVPPLALPAGQGLVVDSYANGLFCGVFEDDKGSALALAIAPHRDGKNGSFLYGDFRIVPGGFAGFWSMVGEVWQGRQDWSQARALTFAACTSRPMTFRITLKGDKDLKFTGTVATTEARHWQRLTLATKDLDNIAVGLGIVTGFDVSLDGGSGQFAIADMRVDGGRTPGAAQTPATDDHRPEVVFAKTLATPTERSKATYYVEQARGDDAGPGTEARPWRTVQKAADTLKPGDTILVKDGTYVEQAVPSLAGVHITHSGASDAWITFKAYPGHHPRVTSPTWATFRIEEAAYIEINGFDISTQIVEAEKKNVGNGISTNKAHHLRFLNNRVHDCGGGGIATGFSDYITVEGNTVYANAFWSIYNCSGISLWEVHDLDDRPGFHNIVRRNVSYQNENKGPTPLLGGQLSDGNGIIIDFSRGKGAILIENNLCYDNGGRGIDVGHARNALVRCNTVVANQRTPYLNNCDLRAVFSENVRFVNNIVVGREGQRFSKNYQAANVRYEHNLFFGFADVARDEFGEGNLVGKDPLFRNPAAADYHLNPGSPALGAGDAAETPEIDLEGRKRAPGAPDLGAYAGG
jgi:parallel beta-helix repeat protein